MSNIILKRKILILLVVSFFFFLFFESPLSLPSSVNRNLNNNGEMENVVLPQFAENYGNGPKVGIQFCGSIPTASGPNSMAYDSNENLLFVADYSSGDVTVIGQCSVVGTISFGSFYKPNGIAYDQSNGYIYVSLTGNESAIGIIVPNMSDLSDSSTNLIKFDTRTSPGGIVAVPSGNVYVSLSSSNEVAVIEGDSISQTISVPNNPEWILYNTYNSYIYVISPATSPGQSSTISVIDTSDNSIVTSYESPVGPIVYDQYNHDVYAVNASSVLSVLPVIGISPNDYPVQIDGYIWAATSGSPCFIFAANNIMNEVDILNITQNGINLVGKVNTGSSPQGIIYVPQTGYLFVANFKSSNLSYYRITPYSKVTFDEEGLPSGTSWSVEVGNSSYSSSSTSFSIEVKAGEFSYSFQSPVITVLGSYVPSSDPKGSCSSEGLPITIERSYAPEKFSVIFEESGLMSGTSWWVELNGANQTSVNTRISFNETYGSYPYKVGSTGHYTASPSAGTLSVDDCNIIQIVDFKENIIKPKHLYNITFTENGLPSGESWSVDLNNTNEISENSTIIFSEPNGTYRYTVGQVSGYTLSTSVGSIRVDGGIVNVEIFFKMQTAAPLENYSNVMVGSDPEGLILDNSSGFIYVANWGSCNITVLNSQTNTVVENIDHLPSRPRELAIDTFTEELLVTDVGEPVDGNQGSYVTVIDLETNRIVQNLNIGGSPWGISFDSYNGLVYVSDVNEGLIVLQSYYNSTSGNYNFKEVDTINVGYWPETVMYDPSNQNIYVAITGPGPSPNSINYISVVDTSNESVIGDIAVKGNPVSIAYDSINNYIFAGTFQNEIFVINGSMENVKSTINISTGSYMDYIPETNYILTDNNSTVDVIDASNGELVEKVNVSPGAWGILYDSGNNNLYVSSSQASSITIIKAFLLSGEIRDYRVNFIENGLASGTQWGILLNGNLKDSLNQFITFMESTGEYEYSILNVSGYRPSNSSGTVYVNNSNVTIIINFSKTPPQNNQLPQTVPNLSVVEYYVFIVAAIIGTGAFIVETFGGKILEIIRRKF